MEIDINDLNTVTVKNACRMRPARGGYASGWRGILEYRLAHRSPTRRMKSAAKLALGGLLAGAWILSFLTSPESDRLARFAVVTLLVGGTGVLALLAYCLGKTQYVGSSASMRSVRPHPDGKGSLVSSYGYDYSYNPGIRVSSAGPLPVGGRIERRRNETFKQHRV
ncbi:MAG: hypothetical protein HXY34_07355 [Candidatus Thorarchaeota archaeon]|nr:hypothetical protein [Candidatus Thorarchaeota archaeon]